MATDAVTVSPTFNGDSVALTAGMIVRLKPGANNNVVRAQADSAPHVQGVNGVVISGASAPGGPVVSGWPGAGTVTINNAPAGSPAAPARYFTIPDGAGGVWTVPSLT